MTNPTERDGLCSRCGGTGLEVDDREIGAEMRQAREHADLSLREMSRRLLLSPAYVSDLELGRRRWRAALTDRYMDALYD